MPGADGQHEDAGPDHQHAIGRGQTHIRDRHVQPGAARQRHRPADDGGDRGGDQDRRAHVGVPAAPDADREAGEAHRGGERRQIAEEIGLGQTLADHDRDTGHHAAHGEPHRTGHRLAHHQPAEESRKQRRGAQQKERVRHRGVHHPPHIAGEADREAETRHQPGRTGAADRVEQRTAGDEDIEQDRQRRAKRAVEQELPLRALVGEPDDRPADAHAEPGREHPQPAGDTATIGSGSRRRGQEASSRAARRAVNVRQGSREPRR